MQELEDALVAAAAFTHLTSLHFTGCWLSPCDPDLQQSLVTLLRSLPVLWHLKFCTFDSLAAHTIGTAAEQDTLTELQTIELEDPEPRLK